MDSNLTSSLIEELHVSEDLARFAANEAEGELKKAREILLNLLPNYLFIKVRFLSSRPNGNGGLIFLLAKKGSSDFLQFRTIFESNRDWLKTISVNISPEEFFYLVKIYFDQHPSSLAVYDSQKLKNSIASQLSPAALQYLFSMWDSPKTSMGSEENPTETFANVGLVLRSTINDILNDILVDRVTLDLDYDFVTQSRFNEISTRLGLLNPEVSSKEEVATVEDQPKKDRMKVFLKGKFVIDPVSGIPVKQLQVGNSVVCSIVERSDIAVVVGRLVGAYKEGAWIPIKGEIIEIEDGEAGNRRVKIKIAQGVCVELLSFKEIMVRTSEVSPEEAIATIKSSGNPINVMPILIAVVLLAILIIVVVSMR
jgi:hypothetical protein